MKLVIHKHLVQGMNLKKNSLSAKKTVISMLVIIAIIASLVPAASRVHALGGEPNLALNVSMTGYPTPSASFTYTEYGDSVWKAVNGVYSSDRWTSWKATPVASEWFEIDFGSNRDFNQVKLYIYNDGGGVKTPASYNLQYWDGVESWVDVATQLKSPTLPYAQNFSGSTPESTLNTVNFNTTTASKLRVVFTHQSGSSSGLVEFEVYNRTEGDIAQATVVKTLIELLPLEANMFLSNKPAIVAARVAYAALTESQQSIVSNLSALIAAEAAMVALEADNTPPEATFLINNGALVTNSTSASLTFSYADNLPGIGKVSLSLDGVSWGAFNTVGTTTFPLSDVDGSQTISAKFMDKVGNESAIVTQSIILDTIAPEAPVFRLSTIEPTQEVTVSIEYSPDTNNKGYQLWGDNRATYTVPFNLTTNRTISAYATDAAGNESRTDFTITNIDKTAPIVTATINNNALFTKDADVDIALNDSGSGATMMRFSSDNVKWTEWETYSATRSYTLPSGDGLKTVYMQFHDIFLNIGAIISRTITLETIVPEQISIIAAYTDLAGSSLTVRFERSIDPSLVIESVSLSGTAAFITDYEFFHNNEVIVFHLNQAINENEEVTFSVLRGAFQGVEDEVIDTQTLSVITPSVIINLKESVKKGDPEFTIEDIVNAINLQINVVGEAVFDKYDVQFWLGLTEPLHN